MSREVAERHLAFRSLCGFGMAGLVAAVGVAGMWPVATLPLLAVGGILFGVAMQNGKRLARLTTDVVSRLERSREEALDSVGAQAQFFANMSHEIRTPMNGILGMAELLVRTELDPDQEQMASTVHASAESLLSILNDILDYSKIEAGKVELETVDFDLWQLIDDCASLMHASAEQKGVELMTFIDPRIHRCLRGDQARLRQVLLNFLGNAVKFTIEGEIVLGAELVEGDDDEQSVRLTVRDTGVGIAPDAIQNLFQPFAQADVSTTRRFGGTGLGLTICRRLAELMGGEVLVESELGKGSTFGLALRLEVGDASLARPRAADVDLADQAVLLVDDNATNLELMTVQLEPTGIGIDTARNAISAIEVLRTAALRGRPFSMAIIDLTMPGFDGMRLAEAIQGDPGIPRLPIALTSSLGSRPGLSELAAADIFRWLNRPLSAGRLLQLASDMASVKSGRRGKSSPCRAVPIDPAATGVVSAPRVLVAEDNEINRRVLAGMLQRIGCKVVFVVDGVEAVQIARRQSFDLVLMDCQMPEMDGFAATRAIRSEGGELADLPILALTANVLASDREACLAAGMNDFLAKPVRLDILRAAVLRWAGGEAAALQMS